MVKLQVSTSVRHIIFSKECLSLLFSPSGDKRLFIRADELEAAWNVFTPVLHEIEAKQVSLQL